MSTRTLSDLTMTTPPSSSSSSSPSNLSSSSPSPLASSSNQGAGSHQIQLPLAGSGTSIHCDTGDETLWSRVRLSLNLDWSGRCNLIGSGVSVVLRDIVGATNCQESMESEEREERWIEEVMAQKLATEVYHGPAFRLTADEAVTVVQSQVERQIQCLDAVADANRNFRAHYSNDGHVAVPFLLTGTVSLKTGELNLCKSHYRYVHNSINYRGTLSAIIRTSDGEDERVHASELNSMLEDLSPADLKHRLRSIQLSMDSDFSVAVIDLNWLEDEELRLAREAQAEALEAEAAQLRQIAASSLFSCFAINPPIPAEVQFDLPAGVALESSNNSPSSSANANVPKPLSLPASSSQSELHLEELELEAAKLGKEDVFFDKVGEQGLKKDKSGKKTKRGFWSRFKESLVCSSNQVEIEPAH